MLFLIMRMLTGVVASGLLLTKLALVGTGTLAMRMFARRKPSASTKMGVELPYKIWKCACGESPVFTDSSDSSCECPGCGDPMENRPRSPHRHGWYSVENDKSLGNYRCTLVGGGTVRVTNVTQKPTGGLEGWPDAVYVGEVVPPDEVGILHKAASRITKYEDAAGRGQATTACSAPSRQAGARCIKRPS